MSDAEKKQGWARGETAEDFANLVKAALGDDESGIVVVPFEDYTMPDAVVFGEVFEFDGGAVSYAQLLSGAVKYFHGLEVTGFQAVPTESAGSAYSMGLQLVVAKPE